jgi:hypothetical protein
MRKSAKWTRLTEWEHWPTYTYYVPLLPFFFMRFLREGHPNHYLTANPGILYSGNGTESKFDTLSLVQEKYRPKSVLITGKNRIDLKKKLRENGLQFPLIAKPDRGFRGYLVKKLDSPEALSKYLSQVTTDVLIQEFIPYTKELGIFYHRYPGQDNGQVTSVTIKEFLKVVGDGSKTIGELIHCDARAYLYEDLFIRIHREQINRVLTKGEELLLSVIGNHSKGTRFVNGNHLIDQDLNAFMDRICKPMEGFYYGRLDIKYEDHELLLRGENFKVIEVNGIISEPTHIYDASHENASFLNALKTINSHWKIMSEIAHINHHRNHVAYPGVMEYINNMRWLRSHSQMLKALNTAEI